ASADAQDGFGCDLISHTKTWAERPRIVLRECAVTLSRSISFKNDSAWQSARRRVRRRRADIEHVAAMFFQVSLKIIAQPVIECDFAADFPVILHKKRHGIVSRTHSCWNAVIAAPGCSNEKAGIVKSYVGWKRYALKGRESCLF